ncbi:hypothetical protein FZ983_27780 [Azospirillum sp. B21]|uniref:hypothetical protein n=1 Tax=Azospirillum sp. B21 TaxID=2607496 RepID=UPI0011EF2049|nr:hypothetical protein [Azospirillum sp. B21]KAA0574346.1 hypothetical protein FZ983_27780 [Azospirillum sp. B21]
MARPKSGWESGTAIRLRWHRISEILGIIAAIFLMVRYDILVPELVTIFAPSWWPALYGTPVPETVGLNAKIVFTVANLVFFLLLARRTAGQMKVWRTLLHASKRFMPPGWPGARTASNTSERVRLAQETLSKVEVSCIQGGPTSLPFANKVYDLSAAIGMPHSDAQRPAQSLKSISPEISTVPALRALDHSLVVALLFSGIIGTFFGLMEFLKNPELEALVGSMKGAGGGLSNINIAHILHGFSVAFSANLVAYFLYVFGRLMLDLCEEEFEAACHVFSETVSEPVLRLFPEDNSVGVVSLDPESAARLGEAVEAISAVLHATKPMISGMSEVTGVITAAGAALAAAAVELRRLSGDMAEHAEQTIAATKEATEHWRASTSRFDESASSLAKGNSQMAESFAAAVERMDSFEKATAGHVEGIIAGMKVAAERNAEVLAEHAQQIGHRMEIAAGDLLRHMDEVGTALKTQITDYAKVAAILDETAKQTQEGRSSLRNSITDLSNLLTTENKKVVAVIQGLGAGETARTERLTAVLADIQRQLAGMRSHDDTLRQVLVGAPPDDLPSVLLALRRALTDVGRMVATGS